MPRRLPPLPFLFPSCHVAPETIPPWRTSLTTGLHQVVKPTLDAPLVARATSSMTGATTNVRSTSNRWGLV